MLEIHVTDEHVTVRMAGRANAATSEHRLPAATRPDDAASLAEAILTEAGTFGTSASRALLVLPSSWCYVHRCDVSRRRPSRPALVYAVEEYLPVEAERLTCDFLRTADGGQLGVAVETEHLRPLFDRLTAGHLVVERITLGVLHAARRWRPPTLFLWCDQRHVTALSVRDGRVADLRVIRLAPGLADELWCRRVCAHLRELGSPAPGQTVALAGCVSVERQQALGTQLGVEFKCPEDDAAPLETSFNLARDALAPRGHAGNLRRVARRSAALALAALLLLAVGLAVHRVRLERELEAVAGWERAAFARVFPGEPVPAGVALRLASERRRLEGLTLATGDTPVERTDALETLRVVIAALPPGLRLDLQELRVEGADVTLRGRTSDHGAAERLATAVAERSGLAADSPRTDRHRDGGVQFFLHAHRAGPEEVRP